MNINEQTIFLGVDLGKYRRNRFEHCLNKTGNRRTRHIWLNEDTNSSVYNFIVNLEDGNECAGTIIESGNWVNTVYVSVISETGTNAI